MIELTREEAILILKRLSQIDGYLFSIRDEGVAAIHEMIDYPSNILTEKLENKQPQGL